MSAAATLSIDVDPVELHLEGYGVSDARPDGLAYRRALPRLGECLAEHGVRATFFVVARDAESYAGPLRELADAGHEIASHSLNHPVSFAAFGRERVIEELRESRSRLEDATGQAVVGFRAPAWSRPEALPSLLAECGYRYDASTFPTPMLTLLRLVIAAKGLGAEGFRELELGAWRLPRLPHELAPASGSPLMEFPVSTSPRLRIPIYHTLRYTLGAGFFERSFERLAARGEPLSYPLHAVDVLGLREDGVDPRLERHPGMRLPLDQKLRLVRETLGAVTRRFEPVPFAERLPQPG